MSDEPQAEQGLVYYLETGQASADEPPVELPPVTDARPFDMAAMLNIGLTPGGLWVEPNSRTVGRAATVTIPEWLTERVLIPAEEGTRPPSTVAWVLARAALMQRSLIQALKTEHAAGAADTADAWAALTAHETLSRRMAALLADATEQWQASGQAADTTVEYVPPPGSPLPAVHAELLAADTALYRALANWYIQRTGVEPATPPKPARRAVVPPDTLQEFDVYTSQDMTCYMQALCAGRNGDGWLERPDDGVMIWNQPRSPFYVTVPPSPRVRLTAAELVGVQSVDSAWALLYALNVLLKAGVPTEHSVQVATLDIDDVILKTRGYVPKRAEDRERARRETWLALLYGDVADITGRRTIPYYDTTTNETLDTELHGPLFRLEWQTTRKDGTRGQMSFITDVSDPTPLRVGYMLTRPAYALMSRSGLLQYLPMAERLGGIPGGQVSGDWARAIGLTLFTEWRKHPRGRRRPFTRRELLCTYLPRTTVTDVLADRNGTRAIEYFQQALNYLAGNGILERTGDVERDWKTIRDGLPLREWADDWLNAPVDVKPHAELLSAIRDVAERLPPDKPRRLTTPKRRPRKPKTGA